MVSALPADQELGPRAPRQEEVSALALTVMSPRLSASAREVVVLPFGKP